MTMSLAALALTAAFDGEAALRHAAALAALGPHPWGSPRAGVAAEYVAAQFRAVGLGEIRQQDFESHGSRGTNVIGVLRAPGPEFLVVGAHHDSVPEGPAAYDDGGGVGVVIEAARVLAKEARRPRTLVFVSWDGEEAESTKPTTGSRAYIQALGPEARNIVAALDIEMCGWKGGHPVFHPIAYADPLRPGWPTITPRWLIQSSLEGARQAGSAFAVGDPLLAWLYQPAVRFYRVRLYGDDLSFLQAGLPAVFTSDSSFTAFYPWYHKPTDTADKIDAASLTRMGQGVLGVIAALADAPRGPAREPDWFAAAGIVIGGGSLLGLGGLAMAARLVASWRAGRGFLAAGLVQGVLFAVLLFRQPVPALWVFLLPMLVTAATSRWWLTLAAFLPALALLGIGAAAWQRGMVVGLWLAPWEIAAMAVALGLVWVRPRSTAASGRPKKAGRGR